jgi:hypothetical protein
MHTPETTTRLADLAERIRDLEAVFSCGGTIALPAPVTLLFADGRSVRVVRERAWTRSIGKKLMARCQPAPFGVGRKTHRDRRVRDGGQLLARDGALRASGLDLDGTGILAEIRRTLCPGDEQNPEAELYALNVYDARGHFVAHKDTPRDPDVFGTLVVCLPVPFRGGGLVLRHGSIRRFEWENNDDSFGSGRRDDTYPVQWAAFYGDVDHEVERVTDGTRVTLTWLLRRAAGSAHIPREPATSELDLEAVLAAALADRRFLPSGGLLGIPCTHLYTAASGRRPFAGTLSKARAATLKGRDRLVALAATRAGLRVRFRPYLFETSGDESWRLTRAPSGRERGIFQWGRLGTEELEQTMPIEHHTDWSTDDDVTWVLSPPWMPSDGDDSSRDAHPASELLGEVEYSATDYFGNEGGDAAFYVSATLLIEVPRARERAVTRATRRGAARKAIERTRTRPKRSPRR